MGLKKCTVFNLGSGQTTVSSFTASSSGKLILSTFYQRTFSCANDEDGWIDQVAESIKEVTTEHSLKGEVSVILPSSKLLAKTLRVPKVESEKQDKIVSFELTQKMPFPLEDLVWDYQVIDDDGIEQEIMAFAVKKANSEQLLEIFIKNGLIPNGLYPSTILDQWALNDSSENENHAEILFINFGAKSTDLVFSGSTGFLVRNIAVGSHNLTQLIGDSLGLSGTKAEEFKIGFYQGKYKGSENDHLKQNVSSAATNFWGKIGQELSRAVVNYKRLKKGKIPEIALITGGGTQLPGFVNFISECLQIPVSYYNPFQKLALSEDLSLEDNPGITYSISESLGLASKLLSSNADKGKSINLLPKEKLNAFKSKRKIPWIFLSFILLALTPVPSLLETLSKINTLEKATIDLKKQLSEKRLQIKELDEKLSIINVNKQFVTETIKYSKELIAKKEVLYQQFDLLECMEKLFHETPGGDLWLDELETITKQNIDKKTKYLKISGRYLVRLNEAENQLDEAEKINALIDRNTARQEALIDTIKNLELIENITKKSFSTEGKGDLFNRFFTHFEFELKIK
jgi:type IV pilus assembly protein PilM